MSRQRRHSLMMVSVYSLKSSYRSASTFPCNRPMRRFNPWAKPLMAVSGLLISWATPAVRVPRVAIFSAW